MVLERIDICSPYQLCPDAERTLQMLTVDKQSRHIRPITHRIVERFDFQDVERVRPVQPFSLGTYATLVEGNDVGREVSLVEYPASKFLWLVDTIALRNIGGDVVKLVV